MESFTWCSLSREDLVTRAETALTRPDARAVVLVGPSGAGKTHLLQHLLARAESRGHPTEAVMGCAAITKVPFGAVLHLLPPPSRETRRVDLLWRAAESLRARARGSARLVLGIDDPTSLDDFSAAVVSQAVGSAGTVAVATAREEDVAGPKLRSLLGVEGVELVPVGPLDRQQTRAVAERSLGGPVSDALHDELWRCSQGNPLLVRELLTGAHEHGRLHLRAGRWHVDGPIARTDRVVSIVAGRLDALDRPQRRALELVVLGEPLDLRTARQVAETESLTALEAGGLVRVERSGRRVQVRCSHPVHAEVVRSTLPELQRRVHLEELVAALEASEMRRIDDVIRVAAWRIECGLPVPDETLGLAALRAVAFLDFDLALRLVREATGPRRTVSVALAEAVTLLARGLDEEGAGAAFDRAATVATTASERARTVIAHAFSLCWVLDDVPAALDLIARELAMIPPAGPELGPELAAARDELEVTRAQLLIVDDRLDAARAAATAVLARSGSRSGARAGAQAVMAELAASRGDRDVALSLLAESRQLLGSPTGVDPVVVLPLVAAEFRAHFAFGDHAAARSVVDQAIGDLAPVGPLFLIPLHGFLADLHLFAGRAVTAREHLSQALRDLPAGGEVVLLPALHALLVEAAARVGDEEAARASAVAVERLTAGRATPLALDARQRAALWLAVHDHDEKRAADLAFELAGTSRRRGDVGQEARWLLLAALLDRRRVASAGERLARLARGCPSPLVGAMADAVSSLAAGRGDQMLEAAHRLSASGAPLHAAELAAAAAVQLGRTAQPLEAARAAAVCEAELARCETLARSPLAQAATYRLAAFLTPREHEVAALAAAGKSNSDIADQLYVSLRTVENHLHRVFSKLHLRRRQELEALFGAGPFLGKQRCATRPSASQERQGLHAT